MSGRAQALAHIRRFGSVGHYRQLTNTLHQFFTTFELGMSKVTLKWMTDPNTLLSVAPEDAQAWTLSYLATALAGLQVILNVAQDFSMQAMPGIVPDADDVDPMTMPDTNDEL